MDSYYSLFNYPLGIILIVPSRYNVFLSLFLGLKIYHFPDSKLLSNIFLPIIHVMSVRKFKFYHLTATKIHVTLYALIFLDDISFKS